MCALQKWENKESTKFTRQNYRIPCNPINGSIEMGWASELCLLSSTLVYRLSTTWAWGRIEVVFIRPRFCIVYHCWPIFMQFGSVTHYAVYTIRCYPIIFIRIGHEHGTSEFISSVCQAKEIYETLHSSASSHTHTQNQSSHRFAFTSVWHGTLHIEYLTVS